MNVDNDVCFGYGYQNFRHRAFNTSKSFHQQALFRLLRRAEPAAIVRSLVWRRILAGTRGIVKQGGQSPLLRLKHADNDAGSAEEDFS